LLVIGCWYSPETLQIENLSFYLLTSALKMGSGEWGAGSGEWGRRIFIVCCARNSWESCTFLKTIRGRHCTPTIQSVFQVLAGSAHPTSESFVESGARAEFTNNKQQIINNQ
jgi:hypothetical protein